jgi:hypothetical protein
MPAGSAHSDRDARSGLEAFAKVEPLRAPSGLRHRHLVRLRDARHNRIRGPPPVLSNGKVANLALRLCGEAKEGQILVDINVGTAIEAQADMDFIGELNLRGFTRLMTAFNVLNLKLPSSASPNSSDLASP